MKVVIPGGSGEIGTMLARDFHTAGHDVVILSRRPRPADWRVVSWDGESRGPWISALEGSDVLINLAGRSVNCRYTAANRREIMDSRVRSTQVLADAVGVLARPPRVWLQASTATIYAHRYDAPNDEFTGVIGGREPGAPATWNFSIDVATSWERAFDKAVVPATRKVKTRSAIVMSPHRGGAFDILLGLVRRGLGGPSGDGRQYVSWIHYRDFIRAVRWLVDRPDVDGAINLAAPEPLPNADFMRTLRDAWGIRLGVPSPAWLLEIGAVVLRTETELVLKSRRVVPRRLLDLGFAFDFSSWPGAARDLCHEWRKIHRPHAHPH